MDMIDLINDEFGTNYEDETSWEQILLPSTLPRSPAQAGLPVGECQQNLLAVVQLGCCKAGCAPRCRARPSQVEPAARQWVVTA